MTLKQECKAWMVLAVGALAIAGIFALLLVLSRTPYVQDILPWPWQNFFHKGLVVHVIFSFVVWFLATMGALFSFYLARENEHLHGSRLGPIALGMATVGCVALMLPALFDLGTAELNNYVPVMSHPVYYAGLVLLFGALALVSLRQLTCAHISRSVAAIYLVACVCFCLAWGMLPDGLSGASFNEQLFWGGGHVLQFVNTGLLILAWSILLNVGGAGALLPASYRLFVFGILLLFVLPVPFIYVFFDIMGPMHRIFFTELLRYGLPLPSVVATVFLVLVLFSTAGRKLDRLVKTALWLSLLAYNLGGLYGLFLDGSDTRVPAHYHAVIGGINLAFMILYHRVILPYVGIHPRAGRLLTLQYWFYGIGQIMHASGMFLAGLQGVPRKTAGAAQGLDNLEKVISMGLMGAGGLIAVIGGVLFVVMTMNWIIRGGRVYETP